MSVGNEEGRSASGIPDNPAASTTDNLASPITLHPTGTALVLLRSCLKPESDFLFGLKCLLHLGRGYSTVVGD